MKKKFNKKTKQDKKAKPTPAEVNRKIQDKYLKAIEKYKKKNPNIGFE